MLALLAAVILRTASIAVTPDASQVVVTNPDSATVSVLDVTTRTRRSEIAVCARPQTVSVDDEHAWVACGDGHVALVDLAEGRVLHRRLAGIEPFGALLAGDRLFVSDSGAGVVLELDPLTLQELRRTEVSREPRGMVLANGRLLVTHMRGGEVTEIDPDSGAITRMLGTGPESGITQALTVAHGRIFVPHTRFNTSNLALRFDTTVFPAIGVIDATTGEHIKRDRFTIDTLDQPSSMPIDIVATAGKKLYVVHAGSDDVSVLGIEPRKKLGHIQVGLHPKGIALSPDESLAFVNNTLSGTVSVLDTATDAVIATIPTTTIPLSPVLLRGKILFHSASSSSLSKDRWMACATCHFEGHADGRTWVFPDGPRNTQPLFGVAETTPLHWSGDLDELHDVESTIRVIQAGSGLADGASNCEPSCSGPSTNRNRSYDLDALATFMASLRAPRRTYASGESVERGAAVFQRAGCVSCHPAPLYTDRRKHDVGSAISHHEKKGSSFDTPSLRGLLQTAPYFHDGSAPTLGHVLDRHAPSVTAAEREDLIAFLSSLPFPEPKRRALGGG